MSVVVKAYLQRLEGDPEIRRFTVDEGALPSYAYLTKKIAHVFTIREGCFQTYWKDDEGDNIAFSTDDELTTALSCMNSDVFRVFIKQDQRAQEPQPQRPSGPVHPGVVCDGCEGPVVGNRYKCAVCPDFDLCATCESKGKHNEHFMMRSSEPCPTGGGFPGFPHHHGPPGGHPGGHHHGPPPPHHHRGRGGPGGGRGRWFRHWVDWMHGTHPKQQRNPQGHAGPSGEEGRQDSGPPSYLRDVGEAVAAMLDPLGIDVQVDVEHGNRRVNCKAKKEGKKQEGGEKPAEGSEDHPVDVDMETPQEGSQQQQQATESSAAPSAPPPATDDGGAAAAAPMNTEPAPEKQENGWTMVGMMDGGEAAAPASGGASEGVATSEGGMAPPSVSPPPPQQMPAPPQQTSLYPVLEPKIAQALEQMKAMGFTDDGGWLSTLLKEKDGDIAQVLDLLSPAARSASQTAGGGYRV